MSPELIAILAVGAALAGLVWQSHRGLRIDLKGDVAALRTELKGDVAALRTELKGDMADLKTELGGRMDRIEERLTDLGDRVSRIEGMLHMHLGRNEKPMAPAE